jgi:HEPN domain-containing protein
MPNTEDYCSAALRHYDDAAALRTGGRVDNATYLGGYVVECALKVVLQVHGHAARQYGHDLLRLAGEALALAVALSPGASRYRVDRLLSLPKASAVWSPDLRYARSPAVSAAEAADVHTGVDDIFTMVLVPVILDGHETVS